MSELPELLERARAAEKEQALFYRALAAAAEAIPDSELAERLNGLHADEQHHLSRLTVRLIEMDVDVVDLSDLQAPSARLAGWEEVAREREHAEIAFYRHAIEHTTDPQTRALFEQFLDAELHHAEQLGGKWMNA